MTKSTKMFFWTFVAVVAGIWIYNRYRTTGSVAGILTLGDMTIRPTESSVFVGPDIDPDTGAYLAPGARAGTSSFPVQPIGG